jgi:hypothetical protein
MPHLGWTNAVPGAKVHGWLSVAGQNMTFHDALGYHDMNWGDYPFAALAQSWYWGHFSLGPYTVVVFDGISAVDGKEYAIAYVSQDGDDGGEPVVSACGAGSSVLRPVNGTWPARKGNAAASMMKIDIPLKDGTALNATAVVSGVDMNVQGVYARGTVKVKGMVGDCGCVHEGVGMFEQFTLG